MLRPYFPFIIILLISYSFAQAKEFPLGKYATIEISDNWDSIPNTWVDLFNSQKGDSSVIYNGGFYPIENKGIPFEIPYIIYNFEMGGGLFFDMSRNEAVNAIANGFYEAAKYFDPNSKYASSFSEFQKTDGNAIYADYTRGMVLYQLLTDFQKGLGIIYQIAIPIKDGRIDINFTVYENERSKYFPIFNEIISSVHVNEQMKFPEPKAVSSQPNNDISKTTNRKGGLDNLSDKAVTYIVLLVLFGLVVWYIYWKIKASRVNKK